VHPPLQSKPVLKQLPEMIQHAGYRKMLYELCERYGSSQFLLFALQVPRARSILSLAGPGLERQGRCLGGAGCGAHSQLICNAGFEMEIANLSSATRIVGVLAYVAPALRLRQRPRKANPACWAGTGKHAPRRPPDGFWR